MAAGGQRLRHGEAAGRGGAGRGGEMLVQVEDAHQPAPGPRAAGAMTRSCCAAAEAAAGGQAEPLLEQPARRPRRRPRAAWRKAGCRCIGFQTGRLSIPAAASPARTASRPGAPRAGSSSEHAQPAGAAAPARLRHEADAGQVAEAGAVVLEDGAAGRDPLRAARRAGPGRPRRAGRRGHRNSRWSHAGSAAPAASPDAPGCARVAISAASSEARAPPPPAVTILLPLKLKAASRAPLAGRPAMLGGAQRLGAVAEHRHPPAVAQRGDGIEVGALAEQVDRHHRARQPAAAGGAGQAPPPAGRDRGSSWRR